MAAKTKMAIGTKENRNILLNNMRLAFVPSRRQKEASTGINGMLVDRSTSQRWGGGGVSKLVASH